MKLQTFKNGLGLLGALLAIVAVTLNDRAEPQGVVEISFPQGLQADSAVARSRILAENANREAAELASRAIVDGVELELDIRLGAPNNKLMVAIR